ncbi:beta-galactosidase [Deinococcus sp. KNUC1210]|uniref:beta-galactosidase n=1 Tax=Deinococcus sp. KNUC1210 TaxID=2917691 RepID=UPI00351CFCAC
MTDDATNHHPAHLELGVCDYPEQVSPQNWAEDARQQKALGLRYVRIAEFAWSRLEPQPGEYAWAWLDTAVELYAAAGLEIVFCTPTAAPPAWLIEQHPEILPIGRDGHTKTFGSRRHYDFSSPVFRQHSRRITRALAERYGQHPAVVGWQTDNEFGWGDTAHSFTPAARQGFQTWLQQRYGSLDALNTAWGNVFWSMEYSGWAQIPLPNQAVAEVNPSHALDFLRYSSDQVAEFQEEQVAILRECSPGRFVTHNYMGFFSAYDHYRVSRCLDFASWDSYPTGTLEALREWKLADPALALTYARTGHPDVTAFNHDLYRGMGTGKPGSGGETVPGFWVMEQQCGQVNWAPSNPLPPQGAVQLWTQQAWAHGADAVAYFRWRAATSGQEVLHSGLLRQNSTPDRGYPEVQALKVEDLPLGRVPARVAVLHDYESLWLYNMQPHADGMNYWAQVFAYYRALRSMGQDVDLVHPDSDLSGYALIVAPALTLMTPDRAAHLAAAAQHAHMVFGPRTGFRNESGGTPRTDSRAHSPRCWACRC